MSDPDTTDEDDSAEIPEATEGVAPETPPSPQEEPEAAEPKKKKFSLNPISWLLMLPQRTQIIVMIAIFVGVGFLLIRPAGVKKPGVKTSAPAAAAVVESDFDEQPAPKQTPAQAPAQKPEPKPDEYQSAKTPPAPVPERSYVPPPTKTELAKAAQTVPRAAVPGTPRNVGSASDVPVIRARYPDADEGTAMGGAMGERPGADEYDAADGGGGTGAGAGFGPRAAGAPSGMLTGKRSRGVEILGMGAGVSVSSTNQPSPAVGATPAPAPSRAAQQATELHREFAPYGRLLKCKLVNTIDSLVPSSSPVIAMVTEDLYFNGKLIVPAGTEAISYIEEKPKLDAGGVGRLFDNGRWTLVLPKQGARQNGREWIIKGRVLDRREILTDDDGRARSWSIDDLSPGFIGYTISTLDNEQIKLFVASFLGQSAAALGETLQSRQSVEGTQNVTQPKPTLKNAAYASLGAGSIGVMNAMVERIREEISQRGFYVRIPGGKDFYVFVEETMNPQKAEVGASMKTTPDAAGKKAD